MGLIRFFKKAFSDMREDARAQHEVDKASFAAARAEAKANFEEARSMGRPESRKKKMAEYYVCHGRAWKLLTGKCFPVILQHPAQLCGSQQRNSWK